MPYQDSRGINARMPSCLPCSGRAQRARPVRQHAGRVPAWRVSCGHARQGYDAPQAVSCEPFALPPLQWPRPKGPDPFANMPGAYPPGGYPAGMPDEDSMPSGPMIECATCGRKFVESAYAKHAKICEKVFVKKRKARGATRMCRRPALTIRC